jgi:hypothetical protein
MTHGEHSPKENVKSMWWLRNRLTRRRINGCLVERKYRNGSGAQKLEMLIVDRNENLPGLLLVPGKLSQVIQLPWCMRRDGYAGLW